MKKKLYTKPELCTVIIDNEISLVMMTDDDNPPIDPGPTGAAQKGGQHSTQKSNFENNPFGE